MVDTPNSRLGGAEPVRWLSPSQLLTTAIEVVQGTIFARFADKRDVMGGVPGPVFKLNEGEDEVWFDYVADTGDGFDATYATACSVMRSTNLEHLPLDDGTLCACSGAVGAAVGAAVGDQRGPDRTLVVLGGDEVYPTASTDAYVERLDRPFRAALGRSPFATRAEPHRDTPVLALPGNHDWYDGLVAFRRAFCESWTSVGYERPTSDWEPAGPAEPALVVPPDPAGKLVRLPAAGQRDTIAGLGAVQSRSYFAIRLTRTWWLWGLDSQLDKPIDAVQLRYFRTASEQLPPDAKVILCTATPSWLQAADREPPPPDSPLYTLDWFLARMPGAREKVRLILTGDKHHYAHYAPGSATAPELVTCGGGGAFMSSTHHLEDQLSVPWGHSSPSTPPVAPVEYTLGRTYPDKETESRQLSGGSEWLRVPFINGRLPLLFVGVHLVLLLSAYWGWRSVSRLEQTYELDRWPLTWPLVWALVAFLALLGLLYTFAAHGRGSSRVIPWIPAIAHTGAQWVPSSWVGFALSRTDDLTLVWGWGIVAWAGLTGWGLFVFAAYLHVCDRFRYHELESYSGLRIEGYKSHLRVHLKGDSCTVHALGIEQVTDYDHAPDQPVRLKHLDTIHLDE